MSPRPSRDTTAGAAYLDLQAAARATGRPVDELFQLYALEGFLRRLVETEHAASFVLKGGVLLAAYTERRPTRDIDLAGTDVDGDLAAIASIVVDIVTVNLDDGLDQLAIAKVEEIRDDASYPGIRATVTGQLDRAKLRFHVDINIGDPLWPEPDLVELPQLLHAEPIPVRAYSAELILAEKIVTAIQRGTASTRWRDFVDIAALAETQLDMTHLSAALQMVADHRQVSIRPLANVLDGYADLAQSRWSAWRNRQALHATPEQFADLLDQIITFADPLLQPLTD
ncbi:MAG: nucleotidyl transferase AbiEii/AbiGii toxin family protein [Acidimicrobiales bacterium]|nr:nucleotidyl transferase AbiEii/AbiGii toxin family protein [Acidimicrobiales bacterium]MXX42393.1 nucleotidyl transferase AbiEii/AbiGii toxin family protein [Acidimicrobiales bacterium]MYD33180.1 nucleotidyl transferase AbiEii/AbiGii toxin family protein [Acidimicrobiales bacterium]MYI10194.1 nucleotidyl transferase AbiEii/AbiGii toxin family protein [Acidimicrobiales bacterium]MYI13119.1 nucleotidyl transferase AbiEii/AbiGii toxin family protein [Acidimicrobiales bacterium]